MVQNIFTVQSRKQNVFINAQNYSPSIIKTALPQDSVLGLLLFYIYNNDLCRSLTILSLIHFADKITVFLLSKIFPFFCVLLTQNLKKFSTGQFLIYLSLNTSKTSNIILSKKNYNIQGFSISNKLISRVHPEKFLGMIIMINFFFCQHIKTLAKTF